MRFSSFVLWATALISLSAFTGACAAGSSPDDDDDGASSSGSGGSGAGSSGNGGSGANASGSGGSGASSSGSGGSGASASGSGGSGAGSSGSGGGSSSCVYDQTSNLCWEHPFTTTEVSFSGAAAYCAGLGGTWRVPTITELRTLARGCTNSETGGLCPVQDGSPATAFTADCGGCTDWGGPGPAGCYWPNDMGSNCGNPNPVTLMRFWSSSTVTDITANGWLFLYSCALFGMQDKTTTSDLYVICVHDGP